MALRSALVPWRQAVQEFDGGVRLQIEVKPGASRTCFPDGFNRWRGRLGIAVQAPAQDGKANSAVCALVAQFFGVTKSHVAVIIGASDSRKTLELVGISGKIVQNRLAEALDE